MGASCLITLAVLSACSGESPTDGGSGGTSDPVAVDNRVKVGGNNWIYEPGDSAPVVRVGAVESFEVVNETDEDISPEVGFGNVLFREIHNGCANTVLKPGQSCIVRGEWVEGGARKATVDVTVTKQNAPGAAKEKISVPLEARSGVDAPTAKAVIPTPVPTSASPSPSETSTTGTPTPSTSTSGTPTPTNSTTGTPTSTTSPGPAPAPSTTLGGSLLR